MIDAISQESILYVAEWAKKGNRPRLKKHIPNEIFNKSLTLCACVKGLGPCKYSVLNDAGIIIGNLAK